MEFASVNFQSTLSSFQDTLKQEELDIFGTITLHDVYTTIDGIQRRRESERTMMDLTRLQPFLDKMNGFSGIVCGLPETSNAVAFIWGSCRSILSTTNQIPKAFDTILDAYEQLGHSLPDLQQTQAMFEALPDLWNILELIYRDVLAFHQQALHIANHPNVRTLFRAMWNDYKPQFETKLKNIENYAILLKQVVQLKNAHSSVMAQTTNIQLVAGNVYGNIDVSDNSQAHIGDSHGDSQHFKAVRDEVPALLSELKRTLDAIRDSSDQQEKQRLDDRLVKVRDWIGGRVPYRYHEQICNVRLEYPQTGLWVLSNSLVAAWMSDDVPRSPMLWIHGIPGAGKTVLASTIIHACEQLPNSRTAYFYCTYDDRESNTSISVLNSLLMQAIHWRPELMQYFEEQRQQTGEPTIRKQRTAEKLVDLVCREGPRTYLVIDGIDEYPLEERKSTLTFLTSLVNDVDQKEPGKLRLLFISQNEPDIKKALLPAEALEIQKSLNGDDIKLFVAKWTEKIQSKFALEDDETVQIQHNVCRYATAQFLYAKLVLENMYALPNVEKLWDELEDATFPKKLSEAYERIITRIRANTSHDEWTMTQQLLGWMTCAARSLKWHEMQGALSINFDNDFVDFDAVAPRRHIQDICGALVVVCDDRISLVHHTAKLYVAQSSHIDTPSVECQMANLCLRYLCFPCFDSDIPKDQLQAFVFQGYYAFADYAVAKWHYHIYRVADQAASLLNENKWHLREDHVDILLETIRDFCKKHRNDLQVSQADMTKSKSNTELSPSMVALLNRSSSDYAMSSFQSVWTHVKVSHSGNNNVRHTITLEKLRNAIQQIREYVENTCSEKSLPQEQRDKLRIYYGDNIWKCSKTSCFYFHQGFKDPKMREAHVARHDRPFYCLEPDCPAGYFGFADKKAFEAHVWEAHPDSDMKAKTFKIVIAKPRSNKYRCEKCDKNFARNGILQAHLRSHAGVKPYECPKCGRAFVRKNDCDRHERKVHNSNIAP